MLGKISSFNFTDDRIIRVFNGALKDKGHVPSPCLMEIVVSDLGWRYVTTAPLRLYVVGSLIKIEVIA